MFRQILLLFPALAVAQQPTDSVRVWLTERVAKQYTVGAIVGFGHSGATVAAGRTAIGGPAMSDSAVFEIGSITKGITGLILADMVLAKEVSLDDPISTLLPSGMTVPSRNGRQITLLDLATASSGLPSLPPAFRPKNLDNPYADYTVSQIYEALATIQLPRDPGAAYEYSNFGMGLLGHLLSLKAKRSYEQLAVERVLKPLGMLETSITLTPAQRSRFATGYNIDMEASAPWDLPSLAGAGALRSTMRDMLKLAKALARPDSSRIGKAIAFARQPRRKAGGMRIGLAWHVAEANGKQIVWHNGGTGGFRTFVGADVGSGQSVVVLANSAESMDDIGFHLLDSAAPLRPIVERPLFALPTDSLERFVGVYALGPAVTVTVTRAEERLYAQLTGQPRFRLWPITSREFGVRVAPARVSFEMESGAKSWTLILDQNGLKQRARRQ